MNFTLLQLPILLPVFFWAGYHYYKDRHLPEPIGHLILAFLLGVGTSYLSLFFYQSLDLINLRFDAFLLAETDPFGLFIYAVLAIGPIEELAKMIPFLLVVIRFKEFNEPIDGIIYASFIALGFAAVENVQYLQFLSNSEAFARGFAGPVVHIVFASIWGYYIGRAYLCKKRLYLAVVVAFLFTALLHGIYDFIVIAMPGPALPIAALLIAGLWIWRLFLIRDLHTLPSGPCPVEEDVVSPKKS
ncbi:MAG: RsiW-degrading membrane proteinase PrsW (M82 family) [Lysobacterales bacterium]